MESKFLNALWIAFAVCCTLGAILNFGSAVSIAFFAAAVLLAALAVFVTKHATKTPD